MALWVLPLEAATFWLQRSAYLSPLGFLLFAAALVVVFHRQAVVSSIVKEEFAQALHR